MSDRYNFAVDLAKRAGERALEFFRARDQLEVEKKGLQDLVSIADRSVEELIRDAIHAEFPDDGFIGEESTPLEKENAWVVDPIDGTNNFLRGLPMFAVSIAYAEAAVPKVGVICQPTTQDIWAAERGKGATHNGSKIQVSAVSDCEEALFCTGFGPRERAEEYYETLRRVVGAGADFRRIGSAALSLAYTSQGIFDAFWQPGLQSWDVLAGLLLVEEAGGTVWPHQDLTRPQPALAAGERFFARAEELVGSAAAAR